MPFIPGDFPQSFEPGVPVAWEFAVCTFSDAPSFLHPRFHRLELKIDLEEVCGKSVSVFNGTEKWSNLVIINVFL